MSGAKIIKCACRHDFQDKEYGNQQRVANINEKEDSTTCTVCGNKVGLISKKK
jgi:hypothetical protein